MSIFGNNRGGNTFKVQGSPSRMRCGMWGQVLVADDSRDSSRNRVTVQLDGGFILKNIPVASLEWTQSSDENENGYALGERNLPLPGCRVFVMMPSGTFSDAFVLCSGFSSYSPDANAPFYADDKQYLRERVRPAGETGGWHSKYDLTTGSYEITSPDEKTSVKIDYGENGEAKDPPEIAIKVFDDLSVSHVTGDDTETKIEHCEELSLDYKKGDSIEINAFDEATITHKKGDNVEIKVFNTTVKLDKSSGAIEISTEKDIKVSTTSGNIEAKTTSGNATVEATGGTVQLKGTNVKVTGTVAPTGTGAFCGIPACLFTGAPHVGDTSSGAT